MDESRWILWIPNSDLAGDRLSEASWGLIYDEFRLRQPKTATDAQTLAVEWMIANLHAGVDPRQRVA